MPEAEIIFSAIEDLKSRSIKPSKIAIKNEVANQIDDKQFTQISTWKIEPTALKHTVTELAEIMKRDKLAYLFTSLTEKIDAGKDSDSVLSDMEAYLEQVENLSAPDNIVNMREAMALANERIEARFESSEETLFVPTGYPSLDGWFGGFQPGKLYYVASRPSQGKTALMVNFALNAAIHKRATGIITIESTEAEITERMISNKAKVNGMKITLGKLTPGELTKISKAMEEIYTYPISIMHEPTMGVRDISAAARKMKHDSKIEVLFIDYAQYIDDEGAERRHEAIAKISRWLKRIALENDIAVVALAQLNREAEGKEPELHHLAESSAFEKDGDVVMMLWDDDAIDRLNVYVRKNRSGALGMMEAIFNKEFLFIGEKSRDH